MSGFSKYRNTKDKKFLLAFTLFVCITTILLGCTEKDTVELKKQPSAISIPIGNYTAGCIKNATELSESGKGYQIIRPSRKRNYGDKKLIEIIKEAGRIMNEKYDVILLIADISKKGGGPLFEDHNSHQIGLDVDILFLENSSEKKGPYPKNQREKMAPSSLLKYPNGPVDQTRWGHLNDILLRYFSEKDEVDRIFVNPAIKQLLCNRYPNQKWLRKLRPWWGHDGHFHVRLKCPKESIRCTPSPPIPEGTGCDEDLKWWFSKEAKIKREELRKKPSKKKDIQLPPECKGTVGFK